ncbi:hypothetical protein M413DRAFT_27773 [Hebeloma cylindrosporum]|uniref:Helicase ATP-binding domain-containing protein n=1 Tax=Hebeloma cylindrosporum TaxID=76867 RepID=A0A0C3BXV1_HEBCY|nr:hypothetical protein M413DRAFT_27773 [Hebeloma cylindrosporum h7]
MAMRHVLSDDDIKEPSIECSAAEVLSSHSIVLSLNMDLEEFDDPVGGPGSINLSGDQPYAQGLELLDALWFIKATRSARWMDLLGDYAGTEPFVIDGEALFQVVLDDPLLLIGKEGYSFQILHAYYNLESILNEFQRRSANFEIVFWDSTKHLTMRSGDPYFGMASRALARSMLFRHLSKLPFTIHVFDNAKDPLWVQYTLAKKPMFVMTNHGGLSEENGHETRTARILVQRAFLLEILSRGISIVLLEGAEYRDTKILSFVYEPRTLGTSDLLRAVHPAVVSAVRLLDGLLIQDHEVLDCHLRPRAAISNDDDGDTLFIVLRNLDIPSLIRRGVTAEVVYLFIVHSILVPTLRTQERAQVPRELGFELTRALRDDFLSPLFFGAASLLASYDYPFEIDGTVFGVLFVYVLLQGRDLESMLDLVIRDEAQRLWRLLDGPPLDFPGLSQIYHLPNPEYQDTTIQHNVIESRGILAFSHPILDEALPHISSEFVEEDSPSAKFDSGTKILDNQHWHNQKSILPHYLGGNKPKPVDEWAKRRALRASQRFMSTLHVQASSLTGASGAILRQIVIAPVGTVKNSQKKRKVIPQKKQPTLSSADKLRLKIKEEKEATSKTSSEIKWTQKISAMSNMSLSNKMELMTSLSRNTSIDTPEILLEMQLFRVHLEIEMWLEDPERKSPQVRDHYTVSIMKMMKDISLMRIMTPAVKNALSTVLIVLGFEVYIPALLSATKSVDRRLGFRFTKLIDTKTDRPLYPFMAITEHPIVWQLLFFGQFMDRSMDSSPDRRVSFEPDAWQRRVLDGINQNKSLLVVAPTSAGKTFISYYAMEKVLRESDDGILVYIAPTKALVSQIAAEVYARFSKNLKGKSCWAIHTRDFRIHDPQNCQILVTVPEMLATMLLSPPLARSWTPKIKRIVLDEIHSIGQQEGGAVWEQILLFAPCPIIGLSATIGAPQQFSDWLSDVQQAHGFEYDFIQHEHRYSHLRKFFHIIDGKATFKSLEDHRRSAAHDFSILSASSHLVQERFRVKGRINFDLESLNPTTFFADTSALLRQKDVLRYEARLKSIIQDLLEVFDPRDPTTPLGEVIESLQDPLLKKEEEAQSTLTRPAFKHDLLGLLADLHSNNDLPAILFNFDRSDCEIMLRQLLSQLEASEKAWRRQSPEWNRKLKQWEAWKAAAPARERAAAQLKKLKKSGKDEGDLRDAPETSWEKFFNPNEPSTQFSFVGHRSTYSKSDLEKDIADLAWVSNFPSWAFAALRRGIAVHHAGTLALGINAPAKTAVFCGDSPYLTALMYRQCAGRAGRRGYDLMGKVVFYGLPLDRVRRLVLSRLPTLGGNFPLTSTMILRLFSLLDGSNDADFAVRALKSVIDLPQITATSDAGRDRLLHHVRFSIEYLRRSRLLDKGGKPINLFNIVAHLYYTEPNNFALVALLRSGVIHEICNRSDLESAKREFMIIMANLFGRRYMSRIFAKEGNIEGLSSRYPSMIVLPPLPESARDVLLVHDKEILQIFSDYVSAFARNSENTMGQEEILPLSKISVCGNDTHRRAEMAQFYAHLQSNATPIITRSVFVANSGHGDVFSSVSELTRTSRAGLNLNEYAIPSMTHLTNTAENDTNTLEHRLNAYILDFYTHGQVETLARANGIRRGDVWYHLQDFALTLQTVEAALKQLLTHGASKVGSSSSESDQGMLDPVDDMEEMGVDDKDPEEGSEGVEAGEHTSDALGHEGLSDSDWNVYNVVTQVCKEFQEKFKAMWA